jgi:hypothetical protein
MATEELTRHERSLPARASAIATFETQLGGREALVEILSQADSSKEITDLISWLANPDFKGDSLASICRMANLTAGDVFMAYERALQLRARVLARIPIAEKLPDVAKKAMEKALTHKIKCEQCRGRGKVERKLKRGENEVYEVVDCYPCDGTGKIEVEPELDQQRLALELGEFCQKSGLTIQNTNSVDNSKTLVNNTLGATLAQIQASAAKSAFTVAATAPTVQPSPASPSVDGEVVDAI